MKRMRLIVFAGGSLLVLSVLWVAFADRNPADIPVLPEARLYESSPAGASEVTEPSILPTSQPKVADEAEQIDVDIQESPTGNAPVTSLSEEVNLAIPFTSQAPHANWDMPYQEFCEEASVLMVASYVLGQRIAGPDDATAKMMAIKSFEEERFGYYEDTTAEETAVILREYYGLTDVEVVYDPTIVRIKQEVALGRAVIVPSAGRMLPNPYFHQPGPLYHMLVIKGYTRDGRFITNDPGTRRGADFLYEPEVLLNATHDWNGGNVSEGRKVVIIVG